MNESGYFSLTVSQALGYTNDTLYTITITFDDAPSYDFSFDITFLSLPVETTNGGTTTTTPGGPFEMALIGILVATVSLIIIIAVVYAFGRFRRSKKVIPGRDDEYMDLPTIMKKIKETEKAKDYRRAIVLCFRAFELISMQELGILSARGQSPRELARLVASTQRIPNRDITMLVMRFEEARYSDHKITKNQFNHTIQALENVQLALKQEPRTS
ncbi:MAG: DUF4129 domain-containing protein [Asgard group archaeon]|nr:DUF4129 domain-containing protein [Asgard group archaeon]